MMNNWIAKLGPMDKNGKNIDNANPSGHSLFWCFVVHNNSSALVGSSRSEGGSTGDKGNESKGKLHLELFVGLEADPSLQKKL
jgi:hypothetical protein